VHFNDRRRDEFGFGLFWDVNMRWILAIGLALGSATLVGQTQPTMQEGLAAAVRQLGACQSELGAMRTMQADLIAGKYMDIATVKTMIEAANPKIVFDVTTHKIAPKPEKTEP
jgi:hypothetical protein